MNDQPDCPANAMPDHLADLRRYYPLLLLVCLLALLSACTANRTGSAKGTPLRLTVGEVKEVTLTTPADTTWQLTATSDNQEVVDVSRKPAIATTGNGPAPTTAGTAIFLVKGVTAGTVRVVFLEKQPGVDGTEKAKRTYLVTVTTK